MDLLQRGRLSGLLTLSSQFLNVLLFNGSPDETVSGRSWREGVIAGDVTWARRRVLIDRVFFWQRGHCRSSHARDLAFARAILAGEAS